jgi:uncharacterized membrane protein
MLTGLFVLLPLIITLWLLAALFNLVDGTITPWVQRGLLLTGVEAFTRPLFGSTIVPIIGVTITLGIIYLAGVLSTNVFGAKILEGFDRLMLRIPGIRAVYGGSRQLMEAFSPRGKRSFSEVVLVEYPRKGSYTLGFVTRETMPDLIPGETETMAAVFLPTTPNPTSGWIVLLPRRELIRVPMSVEEGVKLVVSGGIVVPESWGSQAEAVPTLSARSAPR